MKGREEVTYGVKDKCGNTLVEPEKITERWVEHFEELLNVEEKDDICEWGRIAGSART